MGHYLVNDTLLKTDAGILAQCTCGWISGGHFSSLSASAAFQEHREEQEKKKEKK